MCAHTTSFHRSHAVVTTYMPCTMYDFRDRARPSATVSYFRRCFVKSGHKIIAVGLPWKIVFVASSQTNVRQQIHARMREAGSTPSLPDADTTHSELHDLRSVAETSWATNSKVFCDSIPWPSRATRQGPSDPVLGVFFWSLAYIVQEIIN